VTPGEYLAAAERHLAASGYAVERISLRGGPAVVGRRRQFRVQWFFTQLKTSVVVAAVDRATAAGWLQFVDEAFAVAKNVTGGLPTGLQGAIGAVPVLAATQVDADAARLATEPPRVQWFTGIALPALVDLGSGRAHQSDRRQLAGAVFLPYLRAQRRLVTSLATP
jgi:hypothetical protein